MYRAKAFGEDDPAVLRQIMRDARLATLVTATPDGLVATALPMCLADEGPHGVLYGHVAKANAQWTLPVTGDALAIFTGPNAYVTPSWYAAKQAHGKVVPTWNYLAVHAYGPVEFFADEDRLYQVVTTLTNQHEGSRPEPWAVTDAPDDFIRALLRAIVGVRLPLTRIEGTRKLSQNRPAADRAGVIAGLSQSDRDDDRAIAALIPKGD